MATPPRKKKEEPPPRADSWEARRGMWRPEFQRPAEGPANTAAGRRAAAQLQERYNEWKADKHSGRRTHPENNDLFEGKVLLDIHAMHAAHHAEAPHTPNRRTRHANTRAPKRPRLTGPPNNQNGGKRRTKRRRANRTRR